MFAGDRTTMLVKVMEKNPDKSYALVKKLRDNSTGRKREDYDKLLKCFVPVK